MLEKHRTCVGESEWVLKIQDQISVWRRTLQSPLTTLPFLLSLNYSFYETEKDGPERFYSEDRQQLLCMQTVSFGLLEKIERIV